MDRSVGLPAVGRATMLGLQLAKPLEYTSWLSVLPTATAVTPQKQSHAVATSFPSKSTTSHESHHTNLLETLNACLQRHGAMDPFRTLFDQSLFNIDTVDRKTEDITTSLGRLQTPGTLDRHADLTAPFYEQVSPIPSLGSGEGATIPFRALFPGHLLSDQVDDIPDTKGNSIPILGAHPLCHLDVRPLSHNCQIPVHEILGNTFTTTEPNGLGPLNWSTPNRENGGRTSPQPSTTTGESRSTLPNSPISSRRSSWATSISTHLGEDDDDDSNLDDTSIPSKPNQTMDVVELLQEYQHYSDLIELGNPQNRRDRDFEAQEPVEEGIHEKATPESVTQATSDLGGEVSGGIAPVDPNASTIQAKPGLGEGKTGSEGTCIQPESMQPDPQAIYDSESESAPQATPAEAAAWAHSYCDVDPKTVKLKVLTDDSGREYVLYRDCFHCVPIEWASEFTEVAEQEQEEDDDDGDSYGSVNETCESARDDVKLGTIPEEEDEG